MGWKGAGPKRQGLCFFWVLGLAPHTVLNHLPVLYRALHGFVLLGLVGFLKLSGIVQVWENAYRVSRMGIGRSLYSHWGEAYGFLQQLCPQEDTTCIILVLKERGRRGDDVGSSLRNAMVQTLGSNLNFPPACLDYGIPL